MACAIALTASVESADWPQFQGPERNGISMETGLARSWPAEGPKILWTRSVGAGYGSPAIKSGKAYVLDRVDAKMDVLEALVFPELYSEK